MRILVVEDEFLVGTQIEDDLVSAGCCVLGPFNTLEQATAAARREAFDLALLDINLNGTLVYPLADELSERGVPFIFLSGYLTLDMPMRFTSAPRIAKPHDAAALVKEIHRTAAD